MRVLSVDLAARFSAWMVRDGREVLAEGDSREMSAFQFAKKIREIADEYQPDVIGIETISPQMKHQIDRPLRFQGIIWAFCHPWLDRILMIQPQVWQKTFDGVTRAPNGTPPSQRDAYRQARAEAHAQSRGYSPPDLVAAYIASLPEGTKVLKKDTNPLLKSMTDYVDAFLICEWMIAVGSIDDLRRITGVQEPSI